MQTQFYKLVLNWWNCKQLSESSRREQNQRILQNATSSLSTAAPSGTILTFFVFFSHRGTPTLKQKGYSFLVPRYKELENKIGKWHRAFLSIWRQCPLCRTLSEVGWLETRAMSQDGAEITQIRTMWREPWGHKHPVCVSLHVCACVHAAVHNK